MFPGQGAQYPGMGRDLYHSEPVFRDTIDRIASAFAADEIYGRDVRDFLLWDETSPRTESEMAHALAETVNAQPALYAVECALTELMKHWGVTPSSVIGHSVGEFAAAVARHPFLGPRLLLKGGTPLNLCFGLPAATVPRRRGRSGLLSAVCFRAGRGGADQSGSQLPVPGASPASGRS